MKKAILLIILSIIISNFSNAQSIEIVRTDVDTSRTNIVTATYLFGFDVYAKDVDLCNGVAFELRFNQTEYVKFSGWQNGDFGIFDDAQVVEGKTQDGKGRIIVGTGTGIPLGNLGIDNPKVIRLEFAVTQSASHFSFVTFEFVQPKATIFEDNVGKKIELESEPITFRIHSFIEVWPGDANNDGAVTFDDYNQVNLYMGMGSATKNLRSFKRPQASTIWKAQRVLAWDSAEVTYADCDGNGDITSTDHLIVTYNIDKTRTGGIIDNGFKENDTFPEDAIAIPIYAHSNKPYIGAAGEINLRNNIDNFLGIKQGDLLKENGFTVETIKNEKIIFSVSKYDKSEIQENGILGYIMLDKNSDKSYPELIELNAVDKYGNIFSLNNISSISDNLNKNEILLLNNKIEFNEKYYNKNFKLVNINSQVLINENINQLSYNIEHLPSGTYFIIIDNKESHKIQVLR